jgi:hypothetical protein
VTRSVVGGRSSPTTHPKIQEDTMAFPYPEYDPFSEMKFHKYWRSMTDSERQEERDHKEKEEQKRLDLERAQGYADQKALEFHSAMRSMNPERMATKSVNVYLASLVEMRNAPETEFLHGEFHLCFAVSSALLDRVLGTERADQVREYIYENYATLEKKLKNQQRPS